MTKQEYINALQKAAENMDQQLKGELLSDITMHFEEAAQNGQTEEEAARALGDPEYVVREYQREFSGGGANTGEQGGQNYQDGQSFQGGGYAQTSTRKLMFNADNLNIEVENYEITVDTYDGGGEVIVEITETQMYPQNTAKAYMEGNTLTIKQKVLYKNFTKWFSRYNDTRNTINVLLPKGFGGVVNLSTVSGRISFKNTTGKRFKMNTVSGLLFSQGLRFDSGDYNSVSGEINCLSSEITFINFNTVSGGFNIKEVVANEIKTNAVSGETHVTGRIYDKCKINAVSGHTTFSNAAQCMLWVSSLSGGCDIFLPKDADFSAKLSSFSGMISCSYPFVQASGDSRNMNFITGSGKYLIECSSMSGNISLSPNQ